MTFTRQCRAGALAALVVALLVATPAARAAEYTEQPVTIPSGAVTLRGVLARPAGDGPFPAYVHVHGSVRVEVASSPPWTGLAKGTYLPDLAREGYVVLRLARRGHFGSDGTTVGYHLKRTTGDVPSGYAVFASLQTDALDLLTAVEYLRGLGYVDPDRVAIGGHSMGGLVSVLAGARDPRVRAIISLAGGFRWTEGGRETSVPFVDRAWRDSARSVTAPVLILWSKNDVSLDVDVGRDLEKRLRAAGKSVELIVYPAHGQDGHFLFTQRAGTSVFAPDVVRFLDANTGKKP